MIWINLLKLIMPQQHQHKVHNIIIKTILQFFSPFEFAWIIESPINTATNEFKQVFSTKLPSSSWFRALLHRSFITIHTRHHEHQQYWILVPQDYECTVQTQFYGKGWQFINNNYSVNIQSENKFGFQVQTEKF